MLARQISYGGAFSTGRVPVCDRRTDKGRMDGHTTTAYTALAYSVAQQKFNDSSFSYFGDIVGAHQNLNGIRYRTTPLSGIVCHPWTNSCYSQFTLSQKTTVFACYTYDLHQQISIIFGKNASAPPDKTRKHENNILHSNVVLLLFEILTSRCLIFSSFIVMQLTFTLL